MTIVRIWPIGLFALTLALATGASIVTSRYDGSIARTRQSSDTISELKQQYETTLAKAVPATPENAPPKIDIPAPSVVQHCSTSLGFNTCSSRPQIFTRAVAPPSTATNLAVQADLKGKLSEINKAVSVGQAAATEAATLAPTYDLVQTIMRPLISLTVLAAALYIVISRKYDPEQDKWAFGSIGTLIGFWLK